MPKLESSSQRRRRPNRLKIMVRRLSIYLVPEVFLYRAWRWYKKATRPRLANADTSDHRHYQVQDGVRLDVYWNNSDAGPGPVASLFVFGDEVLRFDCFGEQGLKGHFHINPEQVALASGRTPARFFFPEGGYEDHIEHAVFELEKNARAALTMNRNPRLRRFQLDEARLAKAAQDMRAGMFELVVKHGPASVTRTSD